MGTEGAGVLHSSSFGSEGSLVTSSFFAINEVPADTSRIGLSPNFSTKRGTAFSGTTIPDKTQEQVSKK